DLVGQRGLAADDEVRNAGERRHAFGDEGFDLGRRLAGDEATGQLAAHRMGDADRFGDHLAAQVVDPGGESRDLGGERLGVGSLGGGGAGNGAGFAFGAAGGKTFFAGGGEHGGHRSLGDHGV